MAQHTSPPKTIFTQNIHSELAGIIVSFNFSNINISKHYIVYYSTGRSSVHILK